MSNLIVVGSQWGDEGKGKITDYFTDRCDMVVRSSGGNNAGHTVIANGITYKLHVIPSGVIQDKPSIIGSGVVIDPTWIVKEMETLAGQGVKFDKLVIDKRAHVIMPYHRYLDELIEISLGKNDIGTTRRGIGPAYTDKIKRSGIRICDLIDTELFREKLKINLESVNREITEVYGGNPMDAELGGKPRRGDEGRGGRCRLLRISVGFTGCGHRDAGAAAEGGRGGPLGASVRHGDPGRAGMVFLPALVQPGGTADPAGAA